EEVDVTDTLMILGQARELVLHARALRRGLLLQGIQDLSIPQGELSIVLVAWPLEEPEDLGRAHVLDLLDANERRLSALALDLLGQPLEVLVALRCVGQQIGRALEGNGAEGTQSPPDAHAEPRGCRQHTHKEKEKRVHVSECNISSPVPSIPLRRRPLLAGWPTLSGPSMPDEHLGPSGPPHGFRRSAMALTDPPAM